MTQDCTQDPLVTPSTLDGMMARWTSEAPAGTIINPAIEQYAAQPGAPR